MSFTVTIFVLVRAHKFVIRKKTCTTTTTKKVFMGLVFFKEVLNQGQGLSRVLIDQISTLTARFFPVKI